MRPLAVLVALLALPAVAPAAEWPVDRGPSRTPATFTFDRATLKAVPRDFLDDHPAVVLFAGTSNVVEADGTTETTTHEVTRLNGRKGVEKYGEYKNIVFDPAYEKVTLHEARVHKADGSIVPVKPRHAQLRDSSTDFLVYDPTRVLVISFPGLEVGDAIEVRWTVRGRNPEYAGHFFTRYNFGDDETPVVRDEFLLRLPKGKLLRHKILGPDRAQVKAETKDEETGKLYAWRYENKQPLPQDDHQPSKEELRTSVAVSTFADWAAVGAWKRDLRADCWKSSPEVKKIVADVTAGLDTPEAKAKALTLWLRRNVRYVSVGVRHDYTPHPPADVCTNRFGDCKDTSQTLAVLLREAGIDSAPVTIGARGDGQVVEEVPSPWGTHAILVVFLPGPDGKPREHWVDTTASLAGWDFLPTDDRDRVAYVVDEKGTVRLTRTPKLTADENRTEQTTSLEVGPDGSTRSARSAVYTGLAGYLRRNDFLEVPPGERRRQVAAEIQDANADARLRSLSVDETALADLNAPVRVSLVFDVPGHFSGKTAEWEGHFTDSTLWGAILAFTVDFDRKTPLDLGRPFESIHRTTVRVAPGLKIDSWPRTREYKSKWGTFRVKATPGDDDRSAVVEMRTRLEKTRVEPEDFDAFRTWQEGVGRGYRAYLTVKPGRFDPADVSLLEAASWLTPGDTDSAVLLARMYLSDGRAEDAARVLARAREFRPGERRLWELSAEAVEGNEKVALWREAVKHFPADGRFALELARGLIDQGDHAGARKALEPLTKTADGAMLAEAWHELALVELDGGRPAKALECLDAARKADAASARKADFCLTRADAHEALKEYDKARAALKDALDDDPTSGDALEGLVRLAWLDGDGPAALKHLRQLAALAGDDPQWLAKTGDWYQRLGRPDEAADLASKATADGELLPLARRTLGLVALGRGDPAGALDHLDKAETDAVVVEARLRAMFVLGRLADASDELKTSKDLLADAGPALKRAAGWVADAQKRATTLRKNGKDTDAFDRAVQKTACAGVLRGLDDVSLSAAAGPLAESALADVPTFGPALALRAQGFLEKGKLTRALEDAEKAIAAGPPDPQAHFVRGRVLLERGKPAEAAAELAKATELSGRTDPAALSALADALAETGKIPEALASARAALKLRPTDEELAAQVKRLAALTGKE